MISSTPGFSEFNPDHIPMQQRVLDDIEDYDYDLGVHEILLSGSVGSAKSILMAHLAVRHCLENSGARVMLGRRALPDLKSTIFTKVVEHLAGIDPGLYRINESIARIRFVNGSEIISRSWADKRYSKLRSLEISMLIIEELTENKGDDEQAYHEANMRVGRLPHIKECLVVSATNPDSPSHWVYKYFIMPNLNGQKHPTRHVYYSLTKENKFLPKSYIDKLETTLDPKLARRMLRGEWLELSKEVIYYAYDSSKQHIKTDFQVTPNEIICISFDFNIGEGKPLSAIAGVKRGDNYHVFAEVIIEGARTEDAMDEFFERGIINSRHQYELYGDASGKARHTSSKRSDYEVIKSYLERNGIKYQYKVPLANPPIRSRHNVVNAYCKNVKGDIRLYLYSCPTLDEGLRLTALKKGANIVEDDSKRFQHVTTALGYWMFRGHSDDNISKQHSIVL